MKKGNLLLPLILLVFFSMAAVCSAQDKEQGKQKRQRVEKQVPPAKSEKKDNYTLFVPQKKVDADTAIALPADI